MTKITVDNFKGMRPKIDDHLLDKEYSSFAENTYLLSGAINPYKSRLFVKSLNDLNDQSIFLYRGGTLDEWLEWSDEGVNVVESTIANEIFNRIYISGASHFQSFGKLADADIRPKVYANFSASTTTHPDGSPEGDLILGSPSPQKQPQVEVSPNKIAPPWTEKWFFWWENTSTDAVESLTDITSRIKKLLPGKSYKIKRSSFPSKDFLDNPGTTDTEKSQWFYNIAVDRYSNETNDVGRFLGRTLVESEANLKSKSLDAGSSEDFSGSNFLRYAKTTKVVRNNNDEIKVIDISVEYTYKDELADRFSFDRFYVVEFINQFGEQSQPSNPSDLIVVDPTQQVSLSDLGNWRPNTVYVVDDVVLDTGTTYECVTEHLSNTSVDLNNFKELKVRIDFKRIYRTVYSEGGAEYKLVAEIPASQNDFVDNVEDKNTTDVLISTLFNMPPKEMLGLTALGTFFAGFSNIDNSHTVHFSVENRPHAWPASYDVTVESKIIGMDKVGNTLVVVTEEGPVMFQGYNPQNMQQVRSSLRQSLTNRLAITHGEGEVYWASPDGICMARPGGGGRVISEDYYLKEEWQALDPDNMKFFLYDRRLMISTTTGISNLIFDLDERESAFVHFQPDWVITGGRHNEFEDQLYFIDNGAIWQWNQNTKDLTWTWRSKEFRFDQPVQWGCVRIWADDYSENITFKLLVDDVQVLSVELGKVSIDNDQILRLEKVRKSKSWKFEIVSKTIIRKVELASSTQDMRGA